MVIVILPYLERLARGDPRSTDRYVPTRSIAASRIRMDDGTERDVGPGDVFFAAPGHDAWGAFLPSTASKRVCGSASAGTATSAPKAPLALSWSS